MATKVKRKTRAGKAPATPKATKTPTRKPKAAKAKPRTAGRKKAAATKSEPKARKGRIAHLDNLGVGAKLKKMREDAGYSQNALAGEMGIPQNYISKYEKGDSYPSLSVLVRLAVFLGYSLDEFVDWGAVKVPGSKGAEEQAA